MALYAEIIENECVKRGTPLLQSKTKMMFMSMI